MDMGYITRMPGVNIYSDSGTLNIRYLNRFKKISTQTQREGYYSGIGREMDGELIQNWCL